MPNSIGNPDLAVALKQGTRADYYQALQNELSKTFKLKLLTFTKIDIDNRRAKRLYSSDEANYAIGAFKPLEDNSWTKQVIEQQQPFTANHHYELKKVFFDHALIAQLGLGSVINWPIVIQNQVFGTVNLLAEEHAYIDCDLQPLETLTPWLALPFLFTLNITEKT